MKTQSLEVSIPSATAEELLKLLDATESWALFDYLKALIDKQRNRLEQEPGCEAEVRGDLRRLRKLVSLRDELLAAKRASAPVDGAHGGR